MQYCALFGSCEILNIECIPVCLALIKKLDWRTVDDYKGLLFFSNTQINNNRELSMAGLNGYNGVQWWLDTKFEKVWWRYNN